MVTKEIRQTEKFAVTPKEFYDAFMDSKVHSQFTGSEANIGQKVGDKFTAHGGYCFGKNLDLEPGKLIIQTWQAHDDNWIEGHESKITLHLSGNGNQTTLEFIHENVPEAAAESIANGWVEYYWEPMREYFMNR